MLERVLRHFTWAFLVQRPLYSIFHAMSRGRYVMLWASMQKLVDSTFHPAMLRARSPAISRQLLSPAALTLRSVRTLSACFGKAPPARKLSTEARGEARILRTPENVPM